MYSLNVLPCVCKEVACLDDPELVVTDGAGDWDGAIVEVRGVGKSDESETVAVRL